MSILAHSCCKVTRLLVGSFMTSLNMHGASLTVLNLSQVSPKIISLLDDECDAPAWSQLDVWRTDARPSATERPEVLVLDNDSSTTQLPLPTLVLENFESTAQVLVCSKAVQSLAAAEAAIVWCLDQCSSIQHQQQYQ